MGTYKEVKAIAICIVMPLILANAQHGAWSTWSECLDIGSYHNNGVVMRSLRSRSCREYHANKPPVNTTDCKELHFEIRTCQKCQNCSQGSTPTTNQQEISLPVNTEELEEYNKMSADEEHHRPHQANHSRQLRAADLFSFLSSSPGHRGKSRSTQSAENSQDFLQLLNLAGRKKIAKNEDRHLNSLWDLVEQIPEDDSNKDDLEKHVDNLNDLLNIAGPTLAKEEQTSQPTIVSPQFTTLPLTETERGTESTSKSTIGYEVLTSYQPVETTETIATTEVQTTSTSSTLTLTNEIEVETFHNPTSLETEPTTYGEITTVPSLPTSFPVISTTNKSAVFMHGTTTEEERGTTTEEEKNIQESWSTTSLLEALTSKIPEEESQEGEIELTTQFKRPQTESTERRPGFPITTTGEYFERTQSENVPAETTISLGEFTTYTEGVATQERKLTSSTRTTSLEFFPVETQSTPRLQTQSEVIPEPDDFLKLLDDTIKESVDKHEDVNPKDLEDLGDLVKEAEKTVDNNQLSQHLDALNKLVKLGETTTFLPTTEENFTQRLTTHEVSTVSVEPERTPLTSEIYYEQKQKVSTVSVKPERTPLTLEMFYKQTTPENFPAKTTISLGEFTTLAVTEDVATEERELTSTATTTPRVHVQVENLSPSRVETQSEIIPEPEDFLKLLGDTINESVDKHEKFNSEDLEDLGNLINEAEETVDNDQLSQHLDALNKLVKIGETTTFIPTTEEHFTQRLTTHEVSTVSVEPKRTPLTSEKYYEQTTPENIPATTTISLSEFTTLAVTEEVETEGTELTSTTITTPRVHVLVDNLATSRVATQSEIIPEPEDFLKLLGDTIRQTVDKHEKVNSEDLEYLGNLINEAETVDNNQLSKNLDTLNELVKLGETTTLFPTTEGVTTAKQKHELMTTLMPESQTVLTTYAPTTLTKLQSAEIIERQTNEPTYSEEPPTQAKKTTAKVQQDFLELLDETLRDVDRVHHIPNPKDLQDIQDLIEVAQETMDNEQLSENLNQLSQILNPVELPVTTEKTTAEVETTPTAILGEDLLNLIDKAGMGNEAEIQEAYLHYMLDEIGNLSESKVSGKDLDLINELLKLGGEKHTTSLPQTEASTSKPTMGGQYLLEFLNKTEIIHQEDIQDEFKDELSILDQFLFAHNVKPGEEVREIINQIGGLLRTTTAPPPTTAAATLYSSTLSVLSTTKEGAALLGLINQLEETEKIHKEENHRQVQNLEDLFRDIGEADQDIFSHELNHLNQFLNPTTKSMETTEFIPRPTTVPPTTVTRDKVLEFVGDLAGLQEEESQRSKEDINIINTIFEGLQESDGDVLNHEVQQLIELLAPGEVTPTPLTTEAYKTTAKMTGEKLIDFIDEFEETKSRTGEENKVQIQNFEQLFKEVKEPNKDILSHEISRLNQLLNPSTMLMETSELISQPSLGILSTTPSLQIPKKNVLDFVDRLVKLAMNETLKSRAKVDNLEDLFEGLNESDEAVLSHEVNQLLELLMPALTTEVAPPTTTLSGQYLLELFNETELVNREKILDEWGKDINLVDSILKEAPLHSNEDLLNHIENLIEEKSTPRTPFPVTTEALASEATAETKEQQLLDWMETLGKTKLKVSENNLIEVQALEEIFKTSMDEDKDKLMEDLAHLKAILRPEHITTQPVTSELFVTLPTTNASGVGLLDLIDGIRETEKDKLEGEQGLQDIQDVLVGVSEQDEEEMLAAEVEHLSQLFLPAGTNTPEPKVVSTNASEVYTLQPTNEGKYLLDLLLQVERSNESKLIEDFRHDENLFNQFVETGKIKFGDDLQEAIGQIGMLMSKKENQVPSVTITVETPSTTTETDNKLILDLIDTLGKERFQEIQGVQDIHDVLVKVHEPDEEDMLAAEVEHLSKLFLPAGASTLQPTTVPTTVSVSEMQPTIEGKYILDLLLKAEQVNGSKLIYDLRNDKNLVNQFVETGRIKFGDDLQEAIGQIGMLMSKKTTEAPVFPTTKLLQQPSVTITVETPSTTTETDNKLILYLIDTLGKEKLQETQGVQDIHDVLVEVHEPDEEDMLAAEVEHLSELFLPAGASTAQPKAVPTTVYVPTMQPTIEGKYILDLLLKVEQVNGSKLIDDLRNDENLVNQFVETGKRKFGDDLQEAIGQIGMLLSKKTTETPSTTTEIIQGPSVTIIVETPEADSELILDLIDTLGKEKLQEMQGAQDIQDVFGELQEADTESVLAEEVKHIADILLPTGAKIHQTTAVPGTFAETVSESELSSTKSTTIGGKYILDFLQQVEKVDWSELIDDFNHDRAVLDQFVETGTVRFGDDLEQAIGQIGDLMSKEITSEVPAVTERTTTTTSKKATSEHPFGLSTELLQSTRPDTELFLDLIDTLGKTKAEAGEKNLLEIQKLQTIFDKEKKPTDEILDVELDHLNKLWGPVEYATGAALVSPWLETTMASTTSVTGENLLDFFDKVAEVAKDEQGLATEGLGFINNILKGVFNESDRFFLNDEVNHLLDLLLPEEVRTSTLSPTEAVTTHLEGFGVTSVSQRSKNNQEALLDLLSGHSVFENKLREDTAEVQNIAELFDNLKHTDKDFLVNEIAKLKYNLQYGEPATPAVSTLASSQQMIPSTQRIIVATPSELSGRSHPSSTEGISATTAILSRLPYGVSTLPTGTTFSVSPSFTTQAGEETFLDNLRYLVGQINTDLPWDEMQRVGALSKELDKDAEQKMEEELGFVKEIMHDVGEMEKITPETATTHTSPTTKIMTSAFNPTKAVLVKETTEGKVKNTETSSETTVRLEVTPKIASEATVRHGVTPTISSETTVRLEVTPKIASETTLRQGVTPKISSETTVGQRVTSKASSETAVRLEVTPQISSETTVRQGVVKQGVTPKISSETAVRLTVTPKLSSETTVRQRVTPKTSSETAVRLEVTPKISSETTVRQGATPKSSSETTMRLELTPKISSETALRLETASEISTPSPTTPYSPFDRWAEWSSWGDCSSTCGLGEQSRRRECRLFIEGLAIPSTNCEGNPAETMACEMKQCPAPSPTTPYSPVDRWTEWSSWGDCSSTCGLGEQSRRRECRLLIQGLVIPSTNCEGSRAETMACELKRCPVIPRVDGQWSNWSAWTDCSSMCGPGNRTRYRLCDGPGPSGDGLPCEGAMTESQECFGDAKICEQAGVQEPFLIRTTPKPHIVRPSRKPVNKTVAVAVLATFISVVVVVLVSCIVFRVRKSYGRKEYRADRPMFYR